MGFVDTVASRHHKKKTTTTTTNDSNIPIIISNYSMDAFVGIHDHRGARRVSYRFNFVFFSSISTIRRASLTLHNQLIVSASASARACTLSVHITTAVSMMIFVSFAFFFVSSYFFHYIAHVCDRLQLALEKRSDCKLAKQLQIQKTHKVSKRV